MFYSTLIPRYLSSVWSLFSFRIELNQYWVSVNGEGGSELTWVVTPWGSLLTLSPVSHLPDYNTVLPGLSKKSHTILEACWSCGHVARCVDSDIVKDSGGCGGTGPVQAPLQRLDSVPVSQA